MFHLISKEPRNLIHTSDLSILKWVTFKSRTPLASSSCRKIRTTQPFPSFHLYVPALLYMAVHPILDRRLFRLRRRSPLWFLFIARALVRLFGPSFHTSGKYYDYFSPAIQYLISYLATFLLDWVRIEGFYLRILGRRALCEKLWLDGSLISLICGLASIRFRNFSGI